MTLLTSRVKEAGAPPLAFPSVCTSMLGRWFETTTLAITNALKAHLFLRIVHFYNFCHKKIEKKKKTLSMLLAPDILSFPFVSLFPFSLIHVFCTVSPCWMRLVCTGAVSRCCLSSPAGSLGTADSHQTHHPCCLNSLVGPPFNLRLF